MRAEDVANRTWGGVKSPGHHPGGKLGELMREEAGGSIAQEAVVPTGNVHVEPYNPLEMFATRHEAPAQGAAYRVDNGTQGAEAEEAGEVFNGDGTVAYNTHIGKLYDESARLPENTKQGKDPDFEVMKRYDPRKVGETHRTYHWKMAAVIVMVGFITTGVAAMTVHWRRDGCLLYKLTVIEGLTDDCCSSDFDVSGVLEFIVARRTAYPPQAPFPPAENKPHCTSISDWRDTDARTAHFIALFFVAVSLLFRTLAIISFLRGSKKMKLFPVLTLCCVFCGVLCILAYYLTWRKRFSTGPALWFMGMQVMADVVAYFATKSSTRLNSDGKMMPKIAVVMDSWHQMPRRVKLAYGYLLLGYAVLILPFVVPWKEDVQCGDDTTGTDPLGNVVPAPCCVWYYLMYTRSRCGSATTIFDSSRASVSMLIATITATVLIAIVLYFQTMAAYLGWKRTTAFPKPGLISAWLMVLCLLLFGAISTSAGTQFTSLYVITCAYEVLNVTQLHWLYWKYHSQLLSDNFNQRRVKAAPDSRHRSGPVKLGYNGHPDRTGVPEESRTGTPRNTHRPILVSKVETRRVKFLGQGYVRGNVQCEQAEQSTQPDTVDINWEEQGNPLEEAFPQAAPPK